MQHIQQAIAAGRPTPVNEEARVPGRERGFKGNATQQRNSTEAGRVLQSVEDIENPFNRLVRQFEALGLGLYPLTGDTLLCSSPIGMALTLPNLHAAKVYLRQIGGAL